ncbi:MAG: hypothetical protein IJY90_02315 [Clostridia bacterium]|nr:hypothetical protein [Clostridia bacterium]
MKHKTEWEYLKEEASIKTVKLLYADHKKTHDGATLNALHFALFNADAKTCRKLAMLLDEDTLQELAIFAHHIGNPLFSMRLTNFIKELEERENA